MSHWRRYSAPIAIVMVSPAAGYATEYLTVQQAQKLCFSEASVFEPAHIIFTPEQIKQIEAESGQDVRTKGQQVWRAKKGDTLLGYFIVDYVIGKHLTIDYAVALNVDESVKQVEILQYRESYGGEVEDRNWLKQFVGKTRNSPLKLNGDVVNIGGATLSSRHVTEGIKRVLTTFSIATKSNPQ